MPTLAELFQSMGPGNPQGMPQPMQPWYVPIPEAPPPTPPAPPVMVNRNAGATPRPQQPQNTARPPAGGMTPDVLGSLSDFVRNQANNHGLPQGQGMNPWEGIQPPGGRRVGTGTPEQFGPPPYTGPVMSSPTEPWNRNAEMGETHQVPEQRPPVTAYEFSSTPPMGETMEAAIYPNNIIQPQTSLWGNDPQALGRALQNAPLPPNNSESELTTVSNERGASKPQAAAAPTPPATKPAAPGRKPAGAGDGVASSSSGNGSPSPTTPQMSQSAAPAGNHDLGRFLLQAGLSLMVPQWGGPMAQVGMALGQGAEAVQRGQQQEREQQLQDTKLDLERQRINKMGSKKATSSSRAKRLSSAQEFAKDLSPEAALFFNTRLKAMNKMAEGDEDGEGGNPEQIFAQIMQQTHNIDRRSRERVGQSRSSDVDDNLIAKAVADPNAEAAIMRGFANNPTEKALILQRIEIAKQQKVQKDGSATKPK